MSAAPLILLVWIILSYISDAKFSKLGMDKADPEMDLKHGNKVAGGGTMDETDEVPSLSGKSNPEDVPFLQD